MVIFAVLTVFWLVLTIGTPLVHCWYSLGRPVTISTPMVLSVFDDWYSVPFVKNSQKTVKTAKITKYTKPRKRRYLAKLPSHVPGQWPQPVASGQGWLYVSTCMDVHASGWLAPIRCRVLLHSLLPTDDAYSSSNLSTTVIKFSIFVMHSHEIRRMSHCRLPQLRPVKVEWGQLRPLSLFYVFVYNNV